MKLESGEYKYLIFFSAAPDVEDIVFEKKSIFSKRWILYGLSKQVNWKDYSKVLRQLCK